MAETEVDRYGLYNESEFLAGSGACGPTILAACGRWYTGKQTPFASMMLATMHAMHDSRGVPLCSATGVTTINNLRLAAQNLHYPVQNRPTVAGVTMGAIEFAVQTLLQGHGLKSGITLMGIANGQVLHDYLTGAAEDAVNLKNHFIGIVGYNTGGYSNYLGCAVPEGFLVVDGANGLMNPIVPGVGRVHRNINGQLGYYPRAMINQAQPFDAFAVTK